MGRIGHDKFDCAPGCPVEHALSIIGGKWKGVILFLLFKNGTMRFNELKKHCNNVTQRMLTNQLRELEREGIITRTIYAQVPPRVDYYLTEYGTTLQPIIQALQLWGSNHTMRKNITEN